MESIQEAKSMDVMKRSTREGGMVGAESLVPGVLGKNDSKDFATENTEGTEKKEKGKTKTLAEILLDQMDAEDDSEG